MEALMNTSFLHALGYALINSCWQMALLWIIYQTCSLLYKNISPQAKFLLATACMFTGFLWFCISFVLQLILPPPADSLFAVPGLLNRISGQVIPYISVLYLVLLCGFIFRLLLEYRHVMELRTQQLSKPGYEWKLFVSKISAHLRIGRTVKIWISGLVKSPVTVGFLKPVILIPVAMINHLTVQQTEAILLHELAHIKRNDYLINLMVSVIEAILFFNPFVHLFSRIIKTERESICDDMVIQFRYEPASYASALLVLEKTRAEQYSNITVAATGKSQLHLANRIKRLLSVSVHKKGTHPRALMLYFATMLMVLISVIVQRETPNNTSYSSIGSLTRDFSDKETIISNKSLPEPENEFFLHPEDSSGIVHLFKTDSSIQQETEVNGLDEETDGFQVYDLSGAFQQVTANELILNIDGVQWKAQAVPEAVYLESLAKVLKSLALQPDEHSFTFEIVIDSAKRVFKSISPKQSEEYLLRAEEIMEEINWKDIYQQLMLSEANAENNFKKLKVEIAKALVKQDWEEKMLQQQDAPLQRRKINVHGEANQLKRDSSTWLKTMPSHITVRSRKVVKI